MFLIIEESKDVISAKVREGLTQKIIDNIEWRFRDKLNDIVSKYVDKQITPELETMLTESKSVILESLKTGVIGVCGELAKSMLIKAEKNMQSSWNRDKIFEGLFK